MAKSPLIYTEAIQSSSQALAVTNVRLARAVKAGKYPAAEHFSRQIMRHANDLRVLARLAKGAER